MAQYRDVTDALKGYQPLQPVQGDGGVGAMRLQQAGITPQAAPAPEAAPNAAQNWIMKGPEA